MHDEETETTAVVDTPEGPMPVAAVHRVARDVAAEPEMAHAAAPAPPPKLEPLPAPPPKLEPLPAPPPKLKPLPTPPPKLKPLPTPPPKLKPLPTPPPEMAPATPPVPAVATTPEIPPAFIAAPEIPGTPPEIAPGPAVPGLRWRKLAWGATVLVVLGLLVFLATRVPSATVPVLTAFILAYLLDPVVDFFEARRINRTAAILVILVASLLVGAAAVLLLGPRILDELRQVPDKLRQAAQHVQPWLEAQLGTALPHSLAEAVDQLFGKLDPAAAKALLAPAGSVARAIYGGATSVLATLIALVMIPVFAFYLLRDFDRITHRIDDLIPHRLRPSFRARFTEIDQVLSAFIRGQLMVASILVVLYAIGLSLVGLPLALVIALLAGLGNMIPYVGTTIGVGLATLMVLLDWHGFGHLAAIYGVFVGVQFLEGWVITPRIVGESVGLSPLAVIIAILVFGELFGFVGILVAVPLAAVLKILIRVAIEEYRASELYADP